MALGLFCKFIFCFCKGNKIHVGVKPTLLNKINNLELFKSGYLPWTSPPLDSLMSFVLGFPE